MEYIDLNLPSGNLWAMNYCFAEDIHNMGLLPTLKDCRELLSYCTKTIHSLSNVVLFDRNNKELIIPITIPISDFWFYNFCWDVTYYVRFSPGEIESVCLIKNKYDN